jgi:DNA-binding beta-propeller fold protein YncE
MKLIRKIGLAGLIGFIIGLVFIFPNTVGALLNPGIAYVGSIKEDEEGGHLSFPSFIFWEPVMNEIYVVDAGNRISIYASDFFPMYTLGKNRGIENPQGMAGDAEGNIYVIQGNTPEDRRYKISVFNACLRLARNIYFEKIKGSESFTPVRLALDKNGNIYVAGSYFPGVLVLNNQGKMLEMISPEEEGVKAKVNSVTIDKSGRIYIISTEEGHIYVYDENRKFLFQFGEKGGSTGKLSRPVALGVDNRNSKIYVVDYMRHTINVYDKNGKYLFEFGGLGWGEGWFQYPSDIAVDSTGRVFIADTFNDRVEVYKPTE